MPLEATDIEGHKRAMAAWFAEARACLDKVERGEVTLVDAGIRSVGSQTVELVIRWEKNRSVKLDRRVEQVEQLRAVIDEMAKRVGGRFFLDPAKVAAWLAAHKK